MIDKGWGIGEVVSADMNGNMDEDFGWGISYERKNRNLLLMQHKKK